MSRAASTTVELGQLGRYRLAEKIGHGGTATIFRAILPGLAGFEKTVVLKRLHDHLVGDARYEQLFVNEARRAASARHPNLVQMFELERDPASQALFMVMEHVDGVDARQLLAHLRGPLPLPLAVFVATEVLSALQSLSELSHRVVHADVTPENVFLSAQGDVKLGDLGMSTANDGQFEPFQGQVRGKVPYMSPEQTRGDALDVKSDVFSTGVVLWEMITGRRLFGGARVAETARQIRSAPRPSVRAHRDDVPAALDALIRQALAVEAEARPDPGDLRAALTRQLAALGPGGPLEFRAWLGGLVRQARLRPPPSTRDAGASTTALSPSAAVGASPSSTSAPGASGSIIPPPIESGAPGASSLSSIPMPGGPGNVETHEIVTARSGGWTIRPQGSGRLWVRAGATTWGPFRRDAALTRLERLPAGALARVSLSTDGVTWRPLPEAVAAADRRLLPEREDPAPALFSVSLADVSLVRVLGDVEAGRLTGRLSLVGEVGDGADRREIDVRDGQLVEVHANRAALEAALDALEPNPDRAGARARAEAALEAPMRWTRGRARFVADPTVGRATRRPLTWMLPRRLAAACPSPLLRARLDAAWTSPLLRGPDYADWVRRLGLAGYEAQRAETLRDGRRLSDWVDTRDDRVGFDLALAWTLLELGALSLRADR